MEYLADCRAKINQIDISVKLREYFDYDKKPNRILR